MLFNLEGELHTEGLSKENASEICLSGQPCSSEHSLSPLVAVQGIWLIRRIPTQPFPHPTIPPSPRSLGSWALLETVVLQGRVAQNKGQLRCHLSQSQMPWKAQSTASGQSLLHKLPGPGFGFLLSFRTSSREVPLSLWQVWHHQHPSLSYGTRQNSSPGISWNQARKSPFALCLSWHYPLDKQMYYG